LKGGANRKNSNELRGGGNWGDTNDSGAPEKQTGKKSGSRNSSETRQRSKQKEGVSTVSEEGKERKNLNGGQGRGCFRGGDGGFDGGPPMTRGGLKLGGAILTTGRAKTLRWGGSEGDTFTTEQVSHVNNPADGCERDGGHKLIVKRRTKGGVKKTGKGSRGPINILTHRDQTRFTAESK